MKNKIIISCQFGTNPEKAIEYGVKLARNLNAQIKLVWSIHTPELVSTGLLPNVMDSSIVASRWAQVKEAEKTMDQIARRYNPDVGLPIITQSIIQQGDPVTHLYEIAEKEKATLVICGMKEEASMREDLLGTSTTKFAEKSNRPTLVVPSQTEIKSPKNILVASPINKEKLFALQFTINLFKDVNPKLSLVNFTDKDQNDLKVENRNLRKLYEKMTGHSNFELLNFSNKNYLALLEYLVEVNKPDLIVFQPDEVFLLPGLSRSSATSIIRKFDLPILLI